MLYHQLINEDKFYVTKAKLLFFFILHFLFHVVFVTAYDLSNIN